MGRSCGERHLHPWLCRNGVPCPGSRLYVGGNFKNILEKSKLDGGKGIPHPGFAMFPASG
jgi:hypothetical protein